MLYTARYRTVSQAQAQAQAQIQQDCEPDTDKDVQIQIHAQPDQTAGPDDRTSEDRARIHSRQQQITGAGTDNSTR